ncbi:MAG: protein phosphatase 2C domain-containing protein [Chloroflexota bacterium]
MTTLEATALTDPGMLRDVNEDSAYQQVYVPQDRDPMGLFIVCDGMGGHLGGEFASYWAVEAIKSEFAELFSMKDPRATIHLSEQDIEKARTGVLPDFAKGKEIDIEALTQTAIQKANNVVYEYAKHKPETAGNAGTTLTLAVIDGLNALIANAGDSRTYLLRDHKVTLLTRDHSLVASLVSAGELLPDEIYTHPQRNVIYRFLGQKGLVQPDLYYETLQPGDYLLLCSDGLWEMIRSGETIAQLIENASSLDNACLALVQAANHEGGEDNIGVVLARVT